MLIMKNNKPISMAFILWFVVLCLFSETIEGLVKKKSPRRRTCPVRDYYKRHLIHNSNADHCFSNIRIKRQHRQDSMDDFPLATQAQIIQSHRNAANVYAIQNLPAPFTEVLVKDVNINNNQITIPLVLKAKIHYADRPRGSRPGIPANVKRQLEAMGAIPKSNAINKLDDPYDDAGHLLAWSLGGGMNNLWNFVPQINRLNQNTYQGGTSNWQEEEANMRTFLKNNQQGFIDWTMVVIYFDSTRPHRPSGFCLNYSATDNRRNQIDRNEMCFSNDPAFECFFDERNACSGVFID